MSSDTESIGCAIGVYYDIGSIGCAIEVYSDTGSVGCAIGVYSDLESVGCALLSSWRPLSNEPQPHPCALIQKNTPCCVRASFEHCTSALPDLG